MNNAAEIEKQFSNLKSSYPGLSLSEDGDTFKIQGMLDFEATYNGIAIEDVFDIAIYVMKDFPESTPLVYETGGRIPKDYHTCNDGSLCLGALLAMRIKITNNPSIGAFVRELVIPYLYSFCYYELYKEMPYGELSHGVSGILESYCELFNTDSPRVVIGMLEVLAGNYRGHHPCPCGSGQNIRSCSHGSLIRGYGKVMSKSHYSQDLRLIKYYAIPQQNTSRPRKSIKSFNT